MDSTSTETKSIYAKIDAVVERVLVVIVSLVFPDVVTAKTIVAIIWRMKTAIIFILIAMGISICGMISAVFFPNQAKVSSEFLAATPKQIVGYLEPGFISFPSPIMSPFGVAENARITAYFNDINYYKYYHRWHKALDLVPSNKYYENNQAFKLTGEVIIFATCSGVAKSLQDGSGANYIYLVCSDNKYAVLLVHNARNFLTLGTEAKVVAGQPVAVMGNTGNSDGAHVHYAIKNIITGEYIDPLPSLSLVN